MTIKYEEVASTKKYLYPETDLGKAILQITLNKSQDAFQLEIYDKLPLREIVDNLTGQHRNIQDLGPPTSYNASSFVTRRFKHGFKVLNRKNVYHPIYEVPITDYTTKLIKHGWTNPKLVSSTAQPLFDSIFMREFYAETNAKRTHEYKESSKVPTSEWFDKHDAFLLTQDIALNPYQKTASYNACFSKGYALFCDPGTGKTAMMLRKLDYVLDHSDRQTLTLIACPKTIRSNWINEINKFSSNKDKIHIVTLNGNNPTDRVVNFINDCSEANGKHIVIITGFETFVQTVQMHNIEYDLLLLDESHNIANPTTKRTKTFLSNKKKFHNVVIATGTPFRNTPFDIYPQLEMMGDGVSGFDSFKAFKDFYGIFAAPSAFTKIRHLEGFQNIPLLQEKLAKYSFIIRKEEALPYLPKKTFSIAECNMTKDQGKVYYALCEQLFAEISNYGPDPDSITVNNILTQMLRLAQITSGYAATDLGTRSVFDPNPKLDLLVKLLLGDKEEEIDGILEDPDRKAIVWCCFKENLKMIKARLALEGIDSVCFHGTLEDKDDIITRYNCDINCRVFIGIAASGGVGLNLVGFDPYNPDKYTTNTTDTLNYSTNWSMVNRLQSIDRAHRYTTRVPQHITDLLVPHSIDMEIYNKVTAKVEMSMSLQNIKGILKSIMKPQVNGY